MGYLRNLKDKKNAASRRNIIEAFHASRQGLFACKVTIHSLDPGLRSTACQRTYREKAPRNSFRYAFSQVSQFFSVIFSSFSGPVPASERTAFSVVGVLAHAVEDLAVGGIRPDFLGHAGLEFIHNLPQLAHILKNHIPVVLRQIIDILVDALLIHILLQLL